MYQSCICLLADVTIVTGNPYARSKAVLAKQKFVNMDQSILNKFTYIAARVTFQNTVIHTRMHTWLITVHKSTRQRCVVES